MAALVSLHHGWISFGAGHGNSWEKRKAAVNVLLNALGYMSPFPGLDDDMAEAAFEPEPPAAYGKGKPAPASDGQAESYFHAASRGLLAVQPAAAAPPPPEASPTSPALATPTPTIANIADLGGSDPAEAAVAATAVPYVALPAAAPIGTPCAGQWQHPQLELQPQPLLPLMAQQQLPPPPPQQHQLQWFVAQPQMMQGQQLQPVPVLQPMVQPMEMASGAGQWQHFQPLQPLQHPQQAQLLSACAPLHLQPAQQQRRRRQQRQQRRRRQRFQHQFCMALGERCAYVEFAVCCLAHLLSCAF